MWLLSDVFIVFLDDEFGDLDFSGKGKSKKAKSATPKSKKKLVLQLTFY